MVLLPLVLGMAALAQTAPRHRRTHVSGGQARHKHYPQWLRLALCIFNVAGPKASLHRGTLRETRAIAKAQIPYSLRLVTHQRLFAGCGTLAPPGPDQSAGWY